MFVHSVARHASSALILFEQLYHPLDEQESISLIRVSREAWPYKKLTRDGSYGSLDNQKRTE